MRFRNPPRPSIVITRVYRSTLRATKIEVGVNLARDDAFRRMRGQGDRVVGQGFDGPDAYIIDDWR